MRKHLIFTVLMIVLLFLILGNYSYGKDFTLNLRERGTNQNITCVLQTVGGNRVLVCSEQNFTLSDPIPIKKNEMVPSKPTTKPTTSSPFLELLKRHSK